MIRFERDVEVSSRADADHTSMKEWIRLVPRKAFWQNT